MIQQKQKYSAFLLYLPLFLVEIYLCITLLLYQFGPIQWKTENAILFWVLILCYHVAFILGYLIFAKRFQVSKQSVELSLKITDIFLRFFWLFLLICTVASLINYRNLTKSSGFLPTHVLSDFISGLKNPGLQYYLKFDYNSGSEFQGNKLITSVLAISSFLFSSMIPICVFLWNRLKIGYKVYFLLLVFFQLATYVGIGTNKGIFELLFLFAGSLFIDFCVNHKNGFHENLYRKRFLIMITVGLLCFSIWFFTYGLITRVGSVEDYVNKQASPEVTTQAAPQTTESIPETTRENSVPTDADTRTQQEKKEQSLQNITNDNKKNNNGFIKSAYYGLCEYVTQGYYGMSLSLDEPFTSTYGIGNSAFLRSNFKSLFGIDVTPRTYQAKISDQWDADMKWHSFYSYMANDISFYGVILLMFFIGAFLAVSWKDAIWGKNLVSQCLLPLFIIMFLYMPANNQIFSVMQSCCAFLELTFLWALVRMAFLRKQRKGGSL